jgi:hypothetical protein
VLATVYLYSVISIGVSCLYLMVSDFVYLTVPRYVFVWFCTSTAAFIKTNGKMYCAFSSQTQNASMHACSFKAGGLL